MAEHNPKRRNENNKYFFEYFTLLMYVYANCIQPFVKDVNILANYDVIVAYALFIQNYLSSKLLVHVYCCNFYEE